MKNDRSASLPIKDASWEYLGLLASWLSGRHVSSSSVCSTRVLLRSGLLLDGVEVSVAHGLFCGQSFLPTVSRCVYYCGLCTCLMIIFKEVIEEVNRIVTDKALVVCVDEAVPVLLGESTQNVVVLRVKLNVVLVQVVKQIFGTQNLGDLDELIRVAVAVEERLFAEDHGSKHGT